nr:MAG TPA: hypothetical protein [Bacteriophage sp.]DAH37560.1 MAG TPA: hypothetical protein [Caudoviricetes sp.]
MGLRITFVIVSRLGKETGIRRKERKAKRYNLA